MPEKRPDLDAVVLDIGNVLLTFDPLPYLQKHFPAALAERLYETTFGSRHWFEVDRGAQTIDSLMDQMIQDAPDIKAYLQDLLFFHYPRLIQPIEATLALLPRLKGAGYPLYLLSNYNQVFFEAVRKRHPFFDLFSGGVISGAERVIKPEPEIYHILLDRYRLIPQRTVFVDDRLENVLAAQALGMQGIHFTNATQLEALIIK